MTHDPRAVKLLKERIRRTLDMGLLPTPTTILDALTGPQGRFLIIRPEDHGIVTLCGSTRFKAEFEAENRRLTLEGHMVLAPGVFGHQDAEPLAGYLKDRLDLLHFRKIDLSGRVHVVNPGGYIGESTRREIEYAHTVGVPVSYLVPVDVEDDDDT